MIKTLDEAIAHAKELARIKRQEAEKYVFERKDKDTVTVMDRDWNDYTECINCAKELEQLAAWLEELQERREADRWIPVSKRLPEKEGRCIVSTDYGDVTMDSFVDGMFILNLGNVTAWKPLPKPYESEV